MDVAPSLCRRRDDSVREDDGGRYSAGIDATDLLVDDHVYSLQAADFAEMKRMVVVK